MRLLEKLLNVVKTEKTNSRKLTYYKSEKRKKAKGKEEKEKAKIRKQNLFHSLRKSDEEKREDGGF